MTAGAIPPNPAARSYTGGKSPFIRNAFTVPRKVRELVADLLARGFVEIAGGGKGFHRKFVHERYRGAVTLSGQAGDDAKPYQEQQLRKALEAIDEKN